MFTAFVAHDERRIQFQMLTNAIREICAAIQSVISLYSAPEIPARLAGRQNESPIFYI